MLRQRESQQLSFYSALYDKISEKHVLKKIDKAVDFSFINELLEGSYCKNFGRPAKEPEMMLKLLLLEYLYSLSDVKVIEEAEVNLAFLWFLGLNPEDKLPDPSLLAKFRTQRMKDLTLDEVLTEIVRQCVAKGIIDSTALTVVDHQIPVLVGKIEITVVTGAVGKLTVARLKNGSVIREVTEKRFRARNVHAIGSLCPIASGPHEIILFAALEYAGTLHVVGWRDLLEDLSVGERNESVHFLVHDGDIAMSPTTVNQIDRAVIVLEQMCVDGLSAVMEFVDEWLVHQRAERTDGRVGNGDLQSAHHGFVLDIARSEDVVVFSVLVDDGRRPDRAGRPRKTAHVDDVLVTFPMHEILRCEADLIFLLVKGEGACRVDHVRSVVDPCLRIGVPAVINGVFQNNFCHISLPDLPVCL